MRVWWKPVRYDNVCNFRPLQEMTFLFNLCSRVVPVVTTCLLRNPLGLFLRDDSGILVILNLFAVHFSEIHDVQAQKGIKKVRDLRFPQRDVEYSGHQGRYGECLVY